MKQRRRLALLTLGALLVTVPAVAATGTEKFEAGWQIRFYAAAIDLEHSSSELARPSGTLRSYGTDTGGGIGVNGEYRFSRRLGIDLGLFSGGSVDIAAYTYRTYGGGWATYDTLSFTPLTVGLDVHLTPESRVDLYVSPLAALIFYDELVTSTGPSGVRSVIDFGEDLAPGLTIGLGVPLGEKGWSFQANITYLDSSLEGRGTNGARVESSYDSTIFGVGAGYRF